MKPTNEDFQPRRDGWFEHRGTWGEVTVGTVLADPSSRTKRWEIVEVAHGHQVEYGHTLWMRAVDQSSGEVKTFSPRPKNYTVRILTQDPRDTRTAPPTPPSDSETIMLLVEQLGARLLARRDEVTGEITCPMYEAGDNHLDEIGNRALFRGECEHLRIAHGIDTAPLEAMDWQQQIIEITRWHGAAHNSKYPDWGKGGFPHRHVPEDLSLM